MGLRNSAETVDTVVAPAVETAAAPAAAPVIENVASAVPAANDVQSAPLVVPPKTAIGHVGTKPRRALEELEGLIDPSTLEYDTFRRITVALDGFKDEAKIKLGTRIKIELMSYNDRFVVSPGVKDDEADKLVRYSRDGINLDDGSGTCDDYVKLLRDVNGYPKAETKRYLNLYGMLVATAKNEDAPFGVIPPEDREIVTVQIPPKSYGKFSGYQLTSGVKVAMGVYQESNMLQLEAKSVVGRTAEYAEIGFSRG